VAAGAGLRAGGAAGVPLESDALDGGAYDIISALEPRVEITRQLREGRDPRAIFDELEREGGGFPQAQERAAFFEALASACEAMVPERERALVLHRRAISDDPRNLIALSNARVLLYEAGRFEEAVVLAQREHAAETDPAQRAELAAIVGEAWLDLGRREKAAPLLLEAQAAQPESQRIQEALSAVGGDSNWRREVSRLALLTAEVSTADAARLYLRAARILRVEAADDPQYEAMLRLVLEFDPGDGNAGDMLESLLLAQQRWKDLEQLQEQRLALLDENGDRIARCLRLAFFWNERAKDRPRSYAWLERALALGPLPQPIAGLMLLRDLCAERGEFAPLLEALDRLLGAAPTPDEEVFAALLAGHTAWKRLGDLSRARPYFERARPQAAGSLLYAEFDEALLGERKEEIPDDVRALVDAAQKSDSPERAIDLWKKAIAAGKTLRTPRRALARLYAFLERWRALVDALKDEESAACTTVEEKIAVLLEIASIYRDHLKHDVLLTGTLEKILDLDPDRMAVLDLLAEQYQAQRRWPELVATIERKSQKLTGTDDRFALYIRMAQLFYERMNNEPEAVQALEAAHALKPDDPVAAIPLEQFYEKRRDWKKLIAFRRRAVEQLVDPAQRLAGAVELARLASERIKTVEAAAPEWHEVLRLDPTHAEALEKLEQLYTRSQEWRLLAKIYEAQVSLQRAPETKVAWLQRLALLSQTQLEDPQRATATWRALLEIAPGNTRAKDALKKLLVAQRAWNELEAFFAAQGAFDEYVRVLERQVEVEDEATRIDLGERMAVLYRDVLDRPDRARRAFEKVLELAPDRRPSAEALIPIYEKAREPAKLAGVLAVQLAHTTDASIRQVRLRRLAELHEKSLGDRATALDWWLRAFADESGSETARAECERLAQATGRWAPLVEAYRRAASGEIAPALALQILPVIARAEEVELHDDVAAIATWGRVLDLDEKHAAARDALERLHLARGEHDLLRALYQRWLRAGGDAANRRSVRYRLARLAEKSGDEPLAIAEYRAILDEARGEREALEALDRLHQRRGEFAALAEVLAAQLGLMSSLDERAGLRFRLAEIKESQLGDAGGAVELYRQLLEDDPNHAGACAALERRLADPEHRLAAALLLDPIWERAGAWEKLTAVREIVAENASDTRRRVALYHSIASLYADKLEKPEAAFAALGRALKADPVHAETQAALERLADPLSAWPALAQLYREVLQRPLALGDQVELRLRLGKLYLDRLAEPERALATFTRVLDLDGKNAQATAALAELRARR
jgi:tetratricopeptide (TPR) repeat protein